jgi:hypothetical protein
MRLPQNLAALWAKKNDLIKISTLKQLIHTKMQSLKQLISIFFPTCMQSFIFSIHFPRILPAIYA